jgi:hypothetical protein
MKVVFDLNLNTLLTGIEIEAPSYEKAMAELYRMTFDELVEQGFSKEFTIENAEGRVVEKHVRVKAYDIVYSIEEDDYEDPAEYTQIINSLPDSLVLDLMLSPEDDLESSIADEITFETDWLVDNFSFMVLEEN